LNPEKDVTFLQIGGSSSRFTAIESGSIQAAMLVPPFSNLARKHGFNQLVSFNEVMSIPLGGLAVHTQRIKERPGEIVKMIKATLKATDYIVTHKADILALMDNKWGVKEADIRDSIYRDMIGLFSRTGISGEEIMKNVVQLVRDTRKTKEEVPLSNIFDWSFARKAQEELKQR
jgi:ABC-type nitrate/sulfonate/bicarbonate transport system substrate-binding protein